MDMPLAWALCGVLAAIVLTLARSQPRARLRWASLVATGLAVLLLAPAPVLGPSPWFGALWWGDFPTIDKAGSFAFFQDGVHRGAWPWALPRGPAVALIGAHLGHLQQVGWAARWMPDHAAFGLVAVAQPLAGWVCTSLWLRGRGVGPWPALTMGLPFGLGLHVMRDINWYTIEKGAVFWLPLWLWIVDGAARRSALAPVAGLTFLWMCWNNLYLGMVAGVVGLGEGLRSMGRLWQGAPDARRRWAALTLSAMAPLPLLHAQMALMAEGAPGVGSPARFLTERAALDVVSLWPPRWNRLELWRAVDPTVGLLGLWGAPALFRARGGAAHALTCGLLFGLALGPRLALEPGGPGPENPLYALMLQIIPAAWRVAKPEVFAEGALLLLLLSAGLHLSKQTRTVQVAALVMVLASWWPLVRAHPAYPGHSLHQSIRLDPAWSDRGLR